MTANRQARRFFFFLLAIAAVLMVLVAQPLAKPLFLASVLAVVLWPLHARLTRRLRDRRSVASAVLVAGVVLLLLAPLAGFSAFALTEGEAGLRFVSEQAHGEGAERLVQKLPDSMERIARQALAHVPRFGAAAQPRGEPTADDTWGAGEPGDPGVPVTTASTEPTGLAKPTSGAPGEQAAPSANPTLIVSAVGSAAKATGSLLFQTVMMMIALFFLLLQGDKLVAWIDDVLPLPRGQTRELLTEFKSVSYAVVVSTVATAGIQSLAALVGYLIARVPHPLFFTAVTFFVAFIPAVGAASVCVVAALVLFAMGHPYMALFLMVWAFAVVGLVDNLAKPLLMRSGMRMSAVVVFFALIGGLSTFGTAGLIIGPLVIAFFLALLRIYQREYKLARSRSVDAGGPPAS